MHLLHHGRADLGQHAGGIDDAALGHVTGDAVPYRPPAATDEGQQVGQNAHQVIQNARYRLHAVGKGLDTGNQQRVAPRRRCRDHLRQQRRADPGQNASGVDDTPLRLVARDAVPRRPLAAADEGQETRQDAHQVGQRIAGRVDAIGQRARTGYRVA